MVSNTIDIARKFIGGLRLASIDQTEILIPDSRRSSTDGLAARKKKLINIYTEYNTVSRH